MSQNMREALIAAYEAGATDVHEHWAAGNQEKEADFTEAARDYADNAITAWNTRATPPLDTKTADDMEGLAILGRLRGAARGLCTEDPADYIPRGISAKDAIAAATLIESQARQIAAAREGLDAQQIARAAFEAGPPDGWEAAGERWADIDDEMRDSCIAFTRNVLAASRWIEGLPPEGQPSLEITEAFATIDAIVELLTATMHPDARRLRDAGGVLREAVGVKGDGR